MSLPVAILAGGQGTRLWPDVSVQKRIPKSLVDVDGKPFVVHQIDLLRQWGLTEIVLCLGYRGEWVRIALGDGQRWGVSIQYVFDGPRPLGTGGALRKAVSELGEAFFVLYGDSYLPCDYEAVEQAFENSGKLGLMTVLHNINKWDDSNVLFRDGCIERYSKGSRTSDMEHIDYGLGVLTRTALATYPSDNPFDLAVVYRNLIRSKQLAAFEVTERFYEIGSPKGLAQTRIYFEEKKSHGLHARLSR